MSDTFSIYTPSPLSLQTPGVMPASPYILYDVNSRRWGRQSQFWLNPRTTLAPAYVGLQGFGGGMGRCCKGYGFGACCAACARGEPCEGAAGFGAFMPPRNCGCGEDLLDATRRAGGPSLLPIVGGAAAGYLLTNGKWTGAVAGAVLGKLADYLGRRAGSAWSSLTHSAERSTVMVEGLGGAPTDWWNALTKPPVAAPGDAPASAEQRSTLRLVQLSVVVGLVGLGLEAWEQLRKRQPNGRRRKGGARRRNASEDYGRWEVWAIRKRGREYEGGFRLQEDALAYRDALAREYPDEKFIVTDRDEARRRNPRFQGRGRHSTFIDEGGPPDLHAAEALAAKLTDLVEEHHKGPLEPDTYVARPRKKYILIDRLSFGKESHRSGFLIVGPGNKVYGIKAYGVPNFRRYYGTLDDLIYRRWGVAGLSSPMPLARKTNARRWKEVGRRRNSGRFEATRHRTAEAAARAYAKRVGARGHRGGWIYSASGQPITQGWTSYADRLSRQGKIAKHMDGYWLVATAYAAGD